MLIISNSNCIYSCLPHYSKSQAFRYFNQKGFTWPLLQGISYQGENFITQLLMDMSHHTCGITNDKEAIMEGWPYSLTSHSLYTIGICFKIEHLKNDYSWGFYTRNGTWFSSFPKYSCHKFPIIYCSTCKPYLLPNWACVLAQT